MGMFRRVARRTARRTTRRVSRRRLLVGTGLVATAAGVGYMVNKSRRNAEANAAPPPSTPSQSTAQVPPQDDESSM